MNTALMEDIALIGEKLSFFSGCTVLVTGATGLIGSIILKAISEYNKKHEVQVYGIGVARNRLKVENMFENTKGISFVYQDICEPLGEISCDYIVHTANSTNSKTFIKNPVEVMDSIYLGTRQMLLMARKANVKGFVYLSSMEVFGQTGASHRIAEEELGYIDIHNVRSCYSEGKRMAECMCKSFAEEYGVPVKVARLAQTFGAGVLPGENRVFAQFARSAIEGKDIILHTRGCSVGNYVYTRDAINAILTLLLTGENGEAYTIVNESTTMTIRDMAELVAEHFSEGRSHVVIDIPENQNFGYAPETHMRLSSKKMESIGWHPEVGIIEMYSRMIPDLLENR